MRKINLIIKNNKEMILYRQLSKYYDKFYASKNYENEVNFLLKIFKKYKINVKTILDVGCGTGSHDKFLISKGFDLTGVDLNENMLRIARKKVRRGVFINGDMRKLDVVISKKYDAVILMFNSILYNTNNYDFIKTLKGIYNHTRSGGILIFDSFTKEKVHEGSSNLFFSDKTSFGFKHIERKIKIRNIEISNYYFIKHANNFIISCNNINKLGLFSEKEITQMVDKVGFKAFIFYDWSFSKIKNKQNHCIFIGLKV